MRRNESTPKHADSIDAITRRRRNAGIAIAVMILTVMIVLHLTGVLTPR